jgi:hypothetical protein
VSGYAGGVSIQKKILPIWSSGLGSRLSTYPWMKISGLAIGLVYLISADFAQ